MDCDVVDMYERVSWSREYLRVKFTLQVRFSPGPNTHTPPTLSSGSMTPNPCCGVRLKNAIVIISFGETICSLIFLSCGLSIYFNCPTHPSLNVYCSGLELVNLLAYPGAKLISALCLWLSATFRFFVRGLPSIAGCITWITLQLGLLGFTLLRYLEYQKQNSELRNNLYKSGLKPWESFAILLSICPFVTASVAVYEIICVAIFIPKILEDENTVKRQVSQNRFHKHHEPDTPTPRLNIKSRASSELQIESQELQESSTSPHSPHVLT